MKKKKNKKNNNNNNNNKKTTAIRNTGHMADANYNNQKIKFCGLVHGAPFVCGTLNNTTSPMDTYPFFTFSHYMLFSK